jgi:hypothetical protein
MSVKKQEGEDLFEIDGLYVRKGRTYLVKDRKDGDAPSGFVAAGVSRLPHDGVGDSFSFYFKSAMPGSKQGSWDTGFYKDSPCYKDMEVKESTVMAAARVKSVLTPYRKALGDDNALDHSNHESLDATQFHIWSGRVFNTNDPIDVMHLYAALMAFQAAPAGQEGASKYRDVSFVVVDTTKAIKDKDEKTMDLFKAVSLFSAYFKTDKDTLDVVLLWTDLGRYPKGSDEGTMSNIFFQTIQDNTQKCRAFVAAIEDLKNPIDKDKMFLYFKLRNMNVGAGKLTKAPNGTIFYEETEIGGDLKTSAENIAKNNSLSHIKKEIFLGEETTV